VSHDSSGAALSAAEAIGCVVSLADISNSRGVHKALAPRLHHHGVQESHPRRTA